MTITRRTVCKAGVAALAAAATGCGAEVYGGPNRTITIAGGQRGALYLEFARLLAQELNAAEPGLRCEVVPTSGSVANVNLLRTGRADLAISQSDIALAAMDGAGPFAAEVPVRGIGRMYEDYLQLVVRDDSPVRMVSDLAGRTISIGALGSGTAIFGERLFDAVGLRFTRQFQPLAEAADSLARRQVDALLWCGGVPTPALASLQAKIHIRLVPIGTVPPALRERFGTAYQQANIPAGGYGQPGLPTIGVANLLLCVKDLPDDVAAAVTTTFVERAARLVPRQALGVQFLDRRTLIGLFGVPMHPGAAAAYRRLHG
ncbi:MAG TPA: TAXI family TRAP transporter solute-binding subunit [Actinophytocola sp.]|jgi:TRAP transporter TAXI family solute receptor|nr:TAXI family TRAP transporter solute-binding subunit [Actinophytocola sp.]